MVPSLNLFQELCGKSFINELINQRKISGECQRERILGTLSMLYLMIGVAAWSKIRNLPEILSLLTPDELGASVSAAAFSKARERFSPEASDKFVAAFGGKDYRITLHCQEHMARIFLNRSG